MQRETTQTDPEEPQNILYILDDEDCRSIIRELENPMTAKELLNVCDIPPSTIYRKLDSLTATSLITEEIVIRTDGRNTTRYIRSFDKLEIEVEPDLQTDIVINRTSDF